MYDRQIIDAFAAFQMPGITLDTDWSGEIRDREAETHFQKMFDAGAEAFVRRFGLPVAAGSNGRVNLEVDTRSERRRVKGPALYFVLRRGQEELTFIMGPWATPIQAF